MKVEKADIPDVLIVEPKVHEDERGFFYESYNKEVFSKHGIPHEFVQDNHVRSSKGVLRGLHYQIVPKAQAKLIRVIKGAIYDVAVDIRKNSPTFGRYVGISLDAKSRKMIYVPEGFAHGYCTLEDGTEALYKVTDVYSPADERGLIWNDAEIAIKWPKLDVDYSISEKDKKWPTLKDLIPV